MTTIVAAMIAAESLDKRMFAIPATPLCGFEQRTAQ